MSQDKALIPTEQRAVDFYGDELMAVSLEGEPYVPLRPICTVLGVAWTGQRQRIMRDAVLSEVAATVRVTRTEGEREVSRELLCLPLEYLNGWLFGISAGRIKRSLERRSSSIRETVIESWPRLSRAEQKSLPEAPPWPILERWLWP
jgi:hypothetical protein